MLTKEEMDEIRHAGVEEWNRRWWNALDGEFDIPYEVIVDYAKRKDVPIEAVKYGKGCLVIDDKDCFAPRSGVSQ